MKVKEDYKLYPKNKTRLIEEIIKAFDDYDEDLISDKEFIELIQHYNYHNENLTKHDSMYNEFTLDKAVSEKIGKSRTRRMEKILEYSW